MTPSEIARAFRMAAAEFEEGREATARHFARRAWIALSGDEGARVIRSEPLRLVVAMGDF